MRITWKDGITTLSTAGAIVLERAYFHSWNWPLISNVRWVIAGLAVLIAISFLFGYVLDEQRSAAWSWATGLLAATAAVLTGLGLIYAASDYVVLLMLTAVVFWAASLVAHLATHRSTSTHGRTYA